MRRLLAVGLFVVGTTVAQADPPTRVLTFPAYPAAESLDRMHLEYDWRAKLPVEGRRDGIDSLQHLGGQIFAQLRNGTVVAINAITGEFEWSVRVGNPYSQRRPLGYSDDLVFVTEGDRITAIERATGVLEWELVMEATPSAPPVADATFLYVTLRSGDVFTYFRPQTRASRTETAARVKRAQEVVKAVRKGEDPRGRVFGGSSSDLALDLSLLSRGFVKSVKDLQVQNFDVANPVKLIDRKLTFRPDFSPVFGEGFVVLAGEGRDVQVVRKFNQQPIFRLTLDSPIVAKPVLYQDVTYLVSQEGALTALNITTGRVAWRLSLPAAATAPVATPEDLYLTAAGAGLFRVDRKTGTAVWKQPAATAFLAGNSTFVYASDRLGRLLVLDRSRGAVLTTFDATKYPVRIANDQSDRLLLASNDGTLLSLHDRNQPKPLDHRPPMKVAPPAEKAEDKKPDGEAK